MINPFKSILPKSGETMEVVSKNSGVTTGPARDAAIQETNPLVIYPASILAGQSHESAALRKRNKYLLADHIYWSDERLYSAVELMAIMIRKSIGECGLRVAPGEKLSNEEENAIEAAKDWHRTIGIHDLFYNYTKDLWKYGDAVDQVVFNGSKGITDLKPLPMHAVTAINNLNQLGKNYEVEMIQNPQWYAVDEASNDSSIKNRVIRKDRILHVSFDNRRSLLQDNMGRWTFNIWSMAPINSLIAIIEWKQQLIRNDILWRNRNVPREHHQLDLSEYSPSKYTGTHSQKLASAKADAEQAIKDYADNNKYREADQGFITGMGVNIGFIEPKTTSYADPIPIIDQINNLIGGPTGTPAALMGGTTSGFTSLVHSASFLALRAEIYASRIQNSIEELTRRHVRLTHPGIREEVLDRLYIKNRLILDRDRAELAKIVAILVGSKAFTTSEIRAIWGLDPLTEKQSMELLDWLKETNPKGSSPEKQLAVAEDGNPDSPTRGQQSQGKRERDEMSRR